VVEIPGEDPLQGRAAQGLREFLLASSHAFIQTQELRVEVLKLKEESTL